MATYKARGSSHCVVYPYFNEDKEYKQQWETYNTELEAMHRKAFIDILQKGRKYDDLLKTVLEYKEKRAAEKAALEASLPTANIPQFKVSSGESNYDKTYFEFGEKWLPIHARKKRFSPNSYDSYSSCLREHIYPYFGDRVMSSITSEDIDEFLDYLSKKPCKGVKSYTQNVEEIPTLSSSTVKKCHTVLIAGFPYAKQWKFIRDIPTTTAPSEKNKKRKAWTPEQILSSLDGIDDKLLHLVVHIAFVCSLRAGETVGIDMCKVDLRDRSFWITQEVQRVSDKALAELPDNEIIRVFPKQISTAASSLILKGPKTEGSVRKLYLTTPLLHEIIDRMNQIKKYKHHFGESYKDYGLLICHPDGSPIDPKSLNKMFKEWQDSQHIPGEERIEFQGLRKSGQMHKVRITQNNYQLVAENGGQTAPVLMSNYNEALDSEKRNLSILVETNFYSQETKDKTPKPSMDTNTVLQAIQSDPELYKQVLQTMLANALPDVQGKQF